MQAYFITLYPNNNSNNTDDNINDNSFVTLIHARSANDGKARIPSKYCPCHQTHYTKTSSENSSRLP